MGTIIKLRCTDQVMTIRSRPTVASGGVEVSHISVDFCSKWDGMAKTAVFWKNEEEAFHVLLDENDTCAIPREVLSEAGIFFFGVFGVGEGDRRRTTTVVRYVVAKGPITDGTKPSDPTPDLYSQLLQQYAETQVALNEVVEEVTTAKNFATAAQKAAESAQQTAQDAATSADTSATRAGTAADDAAKSAKSADDAAKTAQTAATTAADDAAKSAKSADDAAKTAQAANAAANDAAKSAQALDNAVKTAQTAATTAGTSATQATTAANDAAKSAKSADDAAKTAQTAATTAGTSATNASASAQNAAKSAQEAKAAANKAGGIKTVNGKTPDENGNVEIDSVASWNDIPDKPFGEETGMVEILPECSPQEDADWGLVLYGAVDVSIGDTCTVNWNGAEYTCVAQELDFGDGGEVVPCLGDIYTATGGELGTAATGEPFVVMLVPGVSNEEIGALVTALDGSTSITLSISKDGTIIKPLEHKYLPDGVPYCIDGGKVEVLAECQPTPEDDGVFILMDAIDIAPGETYMVQWNGLEYSCVAQEIVDDGLTGAVLGDPGVLDGAPPTGEPFIIVVYPPEIAASYGFGGMILALDNTIELTLAIYRGGAEIRKLDNRCLDLEWIPSTETFEVEVLADTSTIEYDANPTLTRMDLPTGTDVIVTFDGVEYKCTVTGSGQHHIGDPYLTTTPFHFFDSTSTPYKIDWMDRNEHTFSIRKMQKEYNKIPNAFLSNGVADTVLLTLLGMPSMGVEPNTTETITTDTTAIIEVLENGGKVPVEFTVKFRVDNSQINPKITAMLDGTRTSFGYHWSTMCYRDGYGLYAIILTVTDTEISVTNRQVM